MRNVAPEIALVSLLLVASIPATAAVDSIEVEVTIDPDAGTINATAQLTITPPTGVETVEVLLNRKLQITAVGAHLVLVGFAHVREGSGARLEAWDMAAE